MKIYKKVKVDYLVVRLLDKCNVTFKAYKEHHIVDRRRMQCKCFNCNKKFEDNVVMHMCKIRYWNNYPLVYLCDECAKKPQEDINKEYN